MENKLICKFFNLADDNYCCMHCPFGYTSGNPEQTCPEVSSVEEAIAVLDDVAAQATYWANQLTNK